MDYEKTGPNQIMRWWLNGELHTKLDIKEKFLEIYKMNEAQEFINDLKWLYGRIKLSVFKRIQSPPIIVLTKTAFGYDLRESILPIIDSNFIKNLEEEIFKKKRYKY